MYDEVKAHFCVMHLSSLAVALKRHFNATAFLL